MQRYAWRSAGDVNAFFGLMLDNVANLVLTVSLLAEVFEFPATFALRYMVPGTAIGVLAGDLVFTWMAFRLSRRLNRNDVTAMPLGLDTPSTLGMIFFVLGPAFVAAKRGGMTEHDAALHAWHIGICSIFFSGIFKLVCAMGSGFVRRTIPRAGLLGSLAAIALVLISFLPILEIFQNPVVGLLSLAVILVTLVARFQLPLKIPGAALALLVGGAVHYLMVATGNLHTEPLPFSPSEGLFPWEWTTALGGRWLDAIRDSVQYLPIVIPFALATVVGGIDCTESAAAAGDEYHTGNVIAVEGIATLLAACCGGVIQTTPYIGHPAYKQMGGRAAYTLFTAIFIGAAGLLGIFGYLYVIIPKAAIFPILVFIGLEITAQSFHATPQRHYPAVALACLPALASLVMITADSLMAAGQLSIDKIENLSGQITLARQLQTMRILSAGFIITSLLWAAILASVIDRRFSAAARFALVAALCSLVGVIHSPLVGSPLTVPWETLPDLPKVAATQLPLTLAMSYLVMAGAIYLFRFLPLSPADGDTKSPDHAPHDASP